MIFAARVVILFNILFSFRTIEINVGTQPCSTSAMSQSSRPRLTRLDKMLRRRRAKRDCAHSKELSGTITSLVVDVAVCSKFREILRRSSLFVLGLFLKFSRCNPSFFRCARLSAALCLVEDAASLAHLVERFEIPTLECVRHQVITLKHPEPQMKARMADFDRKSL